MPRYTGQPLRGQQGLPGEQVAGALLQALRVGGHDQRGAKLDVVSLDMMPGLMQGSELAAAGAGRQGDTQGRRAAVAAIGPGDRAPVTHIRIGNPFHLHFRP